MFADGETQAQVARRLGVGPATVSKWHRDWLAALPTGHPAQFSEADRPTIKRQDTEASVIVAALESAMCDIRERHADLPRPVIALAGSNRKRGHYIHESWTSDAGKRPELFISGERLRDGPAGVLETLLHESAHGLASARGIRDTSRAGAYHNGKFAALAESVGLDVLKTGSRGWSDTSLRPATADDYTSTLERLADALDIYRDGDSPAKPPARNNPAALCGCDPPARIRVAAATLQPPGYESGRIVCRICAELFTIPGDVPGDVT